MPVVNKWAKCVFNVVGFISTLNLEEGFFIFCLRDSDSYSNILIGGPFSLRGNMIWLIPWRPLFRPWFESFSSAPICVRLIGLPMELWNVDSVSLIAASLSKVLAIDHRSFSFQRGRYIRVCIEINLSLPLQQGLWIEEPEKEFFQPITYKNLPSVCYAYGRIGHQEVDCTPLNLHPPPRMLKLQLPCISIPHRPLFST
ncbi:hypothetical protein Cni_G17004 [Canna indica]|uniref:DUF4283 domain-containing protein n=1 Tax=Canna indica TaxID=4628 RepID=A0AAQ3KLQ9_9LILI|nr:hypothetical protein Cni_G17004 [Canna indica]